MGNIYDFSIYINCCSFLQKEIYHGNFELVCTKVQGDFVVTLTFAYRDPVFYLFVRPSLNICDHPSVDRSVQGRNSEIL